MAASLVRVAQNFMKSVPVDFNMVYGMSTYWTVEDQGYLKTGEMFFAFTNDDRPLFGYVARVTGTAPTVPEGFEVVRFELVDNVSLERPHP